MANNEHYKQIDLPFYQNKVAHILPPEILDFHAHIWTREHWKEVPWEIRPRRTGSKYMVTLEEYGTERLLSDAKTIFPDRQYNAVVFGYPTPAADLDKTNDYAAKSASGGQDLYPLLITGRGLIAKPELVNKIRNEGFFGYKVLLNWFGDDYGQVRVEDMIGPEEMSLADELGLVVLLHVPRSKRLTDPVVQHGVRDYARDYPNAQIVLAHCGRCYHPDEMKAAIGSIRDLKNVYLDTAMVMDPTVVQIVLDNVDSSRVLFGTDFPVANMRGRRVYVMDHWVDVVLPGYPSSAYRIASDDIRATFMAYEIILAIKRAGEMVGLTQEQLSGIFYKNGMALLHRVREIE